MPPDFTRRGATLLIAGAGAAVFYGLGLPLPFLFGPMTACLIAALARAPLKGMGAVSTMARTILGVAVGASITPEVVGRIPHMLGSVSLVVAYVVIIGAVGFPFFRRLGYDPATAWYAAMPGGLQDMVAFGQEAGGDARALALIHATRVLVVVTLLGCLVLTWYAISALRQAMRPEVLVADGTGEPVPLASVALTAVVLTWLDPHVYLATVVLHGSVGST